MLQVWYRNFNFSTNHFNRQDMTMNQLMIVNWDVDQSATDDSSDSNSEIFNHQSADFDNVVL